MSEGEKVQFLEERVAFLERHVELQDAEMLEQMRVLRRLVERVNVGGASSRRCDGRGRSSG